MTCKMTNMAAKGKEKKKKAAGFPHQQGPSSAALAASNCTHLGSMPLVLLGEIQAPGLGWKG